MIEDTGVRPQPEEPSPWTPDMVKGVIDGFSGLADRYLGLKESEFSHTVKVHELESNTERSILRILLIFLSVIVGLMVWLTFADKVSGDALLFMTGTIAGYILAIVQRQLFPATSDSHRH